MKFRIKNNAWRIDSDTGFLHLTISAMRVGAMSYAIEEWPYAPDYLKNKEKLQIFTPEDELCRLSSLSGLKSALVVEGHTWQTTETSNLSVGHTVSDAYYDFEQGLVIVDIVVTDESVIQKIINEELRDVSAAYDCNIDWTPNGTYDGIVSELKYNHIALIPAGSGRGGDSVRILNRAIKKEESIMPDETKLVRVRLQNGADVEVRKEDADKVSNLVDMSQLEASLKELQDMKDSVAKKEGEIQALKEQLEAALSPAVIEEKAEELANEYAEAEQVMNSIGLDKNQFTGKRGHELRLAIIEQHRVINQRPALTKEQRESEQYVQGMYGVLAESQPAQAVAGAQVMNNAPQTQTNSATLGVEHWFKTAAGGK